MQALPNLRALFGLGLLLPLFVQPLVAREKTVAELTALHCGTLLAVAGEALQTEVSLIVRDSQVVAVLPGYVEGIYGLAVDIGSRLGCGAHVEVLRRLGSGPYKAQDMIDLPGLEKLAELGTEQLDDALLAVDSALLDLPSASLDDALVQLVRQGQPVTASGTPKSGKLRIYDSRQRFLGLAEVQQDGRIAPRRLLSAINS